MSVTIGEHNEPEILKLMVLAYGMNHSYRVLGIDEIAQAVSHVKRDEVREVLERLAQEGLVTKFSGRYCFNKPIPVDLRHSVDESITPSGTIRRRSTVAH